MDAVVIVALIMPWVFLLVLLWFVYTLVRQHGRTLLDYETLGRRVAALEAGGAAQAAAPAPDYSGLPVGAAAPDFALPDLDGRQRRLEEFLGQPLAIVFWSPTCGYCAEMAPMLRELPKEPRVLLVATGGVEANRRMSEEHGFGRDIVLDTERADVFSAYKAPGTPAGYVLDAEGRVASDLAVGSAQLLELLASPTRNGGSNGHGGAEHAGSLRLRGVETSRIDREGLSAGTPAPDFTLPDVRGKKHSLAEFRGQRVLLVFSDPECSPCNELSRELADLQRQHRDEFTVVMVSRGDPKANRKKIAEHGLDFPVLLQKGWRVSKDYAMFGTPIGYLIDEQGVIAKDPAVGAIEIRRLVEEFTPAAVPG